MSIADVTIVTEESFGASLLYWIEHMATDYELTKLRDLLVDKKVVPDHQQIEYIPPYTFP